MSGHSAGRAAEPRRRALRLEGHAALLTGSVRFSRRLLAHTENIQRTYFSSLFLSVMTLTAGITAEAAIRSGGGEELVTMLALHVTGNGFATANRFVTSNSRDRLEHPVFGSRQMCRWRHIWHQSIFQE